jgi:hypothetical protein
VRRRLEQLDRVAVGISQLDLFAGLLRGPHPQGRPAEPIERPNRFQLTLNLRTARDQLRVPTVALLRADETVQ